MLKFLAIPFYLYYYLEWLIKLVVNTGINIMSLKFTKTSRKNELEGTWLDFDDGLGNILKVLVARTDGNPHYESALTKAMAPYKKKMERGRNISNDVAKRIMTKVLSQEILLGWDESVLLDDEGKSVKYSKENALELLNDDNDLRDFVTTESGNIDNFLIKKK